MQRLGLAPSAKLRQHFVALARRVREWNGDRRPTKIGITSVKRRAGRSTVAFNLAAALTRIENAPTLLVESDFGRHHIARRLGIAGGSGLSDLMTGNAELADCVTDTPIERFSVMSSGRVSEQESLELPFERLQSILESDFQRFGCILFDLPIANDLTSCYSIVPHLDGVILTLDASVTERQQVEKAKQRLAACGTELIGAVLNRNG